MSGAGPGRTVFGICGGISVGAPPGPTCTPQNCEVQSRCSCGIAPDDPSVPEAAAADVSPAEAGVAGSEAGAAPDAGVAPEVAAGTDAGVGSAGAEHVSAAATGELPWAGADVSAGVETAGAEVSDAGDEQDAGAASAGAETVDVTGSASSVSDIAGVSFRLFHYDRSISRNPPFAGTSGWPTPARAKDAWSIHVEFPAGTSIFERCHVIDDGHIK